jgi:hypothetical protein
MAVSYGARGTGNVPNQKSALLGAIRKRRRKRRKRRR